uniref:Cation-transporting P-type ATPase N-terminal domain-containing protein n=1 Tax=Triticum urartu TaxID=4572 RepID=A0A8R7Q1E4_TRIUA
SHCRCCHHGHHRALIPPSLLVSSHRAGCRRAALLSRRAGLAELVVSANRDISSEDAAARLQRYGPNKLEWPERPISTITRNPSLPPFPWRGMPSKRSVRCVCASIVSSPLLIILFHLIYACVRDISSHLYSCAGRPWSSCLVQGHALAAPYVERVDGPDSALGT